MSVVCIRGAITVEKNDKEEIYDASYRMIKEIIERNDLNVDNIISITFTATKDFRPGISGSCCKKTWNCRCITYVCSRVICRR